MNLWSSWQIHPINVQHQLVVLNDLKRFDDRLVKLPQRNAIKKETRSTKKVQRANWKIRLFLKPVGRIPKTLRFCATVSRHSFCSCLQTQDVMKMLQRIAQSCLEFHVSELYIAHRSHLCRSRQELCKFTCSFQDLSNIYLKASQSCQQSLIQPIISWYQELVSWNGGINGMSTGSLVHSRVTRPLSARHAHPRLHSASSL